MMAVGVNIRPFVSRVPTGWWERSVFSLCISFSLSCIHTHTSYTYAHIRAYAYTLVVFVTCARRLNLSGTYVENFPNNKHATRSFTERAGCALQIRSSNSDTVEYAGRTTLILMDENSPNFPQDSTRPGDLLSRALCCFLFLLRRRKRVRQRREHLCSETSRGVKEPVLSFYLHLSLPLSPRTSSLKLSRLQTANEPVHPPRNT